MEAELADLQCQSWALGRQLNSLYRTLEQIGGIAVRPVERAASAPASRADREHVRHLLAALETEEAELRLEIRDLLVKLPVRPPQPDDVPALAPAADALRTFLASHGGETGGWDDRDHALFLQWRSRFRNNRQSFVNAVADTVPGKTAAQVEAHERWYQQVLKLRHEQRLELDEWKRRKRAQEEEERKRALESQQDANEANVWVSKWRQQRENVRHQVQRWKEERAKAMAEAEAEAAEPSEIDMQRKEAELKRQMELQYQKLVAYLWRAEQEAARQAAKSADDYVSELGRKQQRRASSASRLVERRLESERQWIDQRRQQLDRVKQTSCAPVKIKRAVSAPRDPGRLLRPTTATVARCLPVGDPESNSSKRGSHLKDAYILDVQSRTVPNWRRRSMGN